ncbi:hypothetical protein ABZ477_13090 [Microbacterium sp. NPDC019599]|uniref:hypothetical protein n=1 Tax=Microbacterium sp. NPDC019599 TaxID=3154690 RepID=UPI0033CCDCA4
MDDTRANNEPIEEPPTGTDQLAADTGADGGDPVEGGAPTGGDETTEEQLEADNPAEEQTLKTLDPDAPPA